MLSYKKIPHISCGKIGPRATGRLFNFKRGGAGRYYRSPFSGEAVNMPASDARKALPSAHNSPPSLRPHLITYTVWPHGYQGTLAELLFFGFNSRQPGAAGRGLIVMVSVTYRFFVNVLFHNLHPLGLLLSTDIAPKSYSMMEIY